jgi:hypothetical protein
VTYERIRMCSVCADELSGATSGNCAMVTQIDANRAGRARVNVVHGGK